MPATQLGLRATLLLTRDCDNRCVFCAQDGAPVAPDAAEPSRADATLAALRSRAAGLTFVGGEPTLVPSLAGWIEAARRAGFEKIGVQTNARALGRSGLARRLHDAGLTDVHVTVLGAEAAVHDYHTGVNGSFVETLSGVDAARAAGVSVVVTTVLTRSNYRSLGGMPRLLRARGASAWQLSVTVPRGRADEAFDRVMPRLGMALPFALHALTAAERAGLAAYVSGAPLCLLGPLATRSIATPSEAPRAYAEGCASCAARDACPGVDPTYLERFAGDELRPRPMPETFGRGPFVDAFVGVGALEPARARVVPEAPRNARRHLTVLSRPVPGAAEVRRAEAKTGEALREILPSLFEPKSED